MLGGTQKFFRKFCLSAGVVLMCLLHVFWGYGRMGRATEQLERVRHQAQLFYGGPAEPSLAVLETLKEANQRLDRLHATLYERLFQASMPDRFSGDSTAAFFELASFVENETRRLKESGISVGESERFGFSQFEQQGPPPEILKSVMAQKAAVVVILDVLREARPDALILLKREFVSKSVDEQPALLRAAGFPESNPTQFPDTMLVGEKLDGFVSCLFELEFEGFSESLRRFLMGLTHCGFPVLVSELRVSPLDRFAVVESRNPGSNNNPFDRLALSEETEAREGPVPIIRNNLSSFNLRLRVVLEEEGASPES